MNLTVYPTYDFSNTPELLNVCEGNNIVWNGDTYTTAGTYTKTLTTANGCDSIVAMTLTTHPTYDMSSTPTELSVCEGESVMWQGNNYNTAGTYSKMLKTIHECDSIVYMTLTVNPLPTVTISGTTTILVGESTTLTASGAASYLWSNGENTAAITVNPMTTTTYTVIGTDANGCEATATVTVTVINCQSVTTTLTETACGSYTWYGTNYTVSGTYSHTVVGAAGGCDSIYILNLTIYATFNTTVTKFICEGDSAIFNGTYLFIPGTYQAHLISSLGCDSIVTCNLLEYPTPTPIIHGTNEICFGDSAVLYADGGVSYLWSTGATTSSIVVYPTTTTSYSVTVSNEYGCSANAEVTVYVFPTLSPYIIGNTHICIGDSTTLTVLDGGSAFLWNTGETTQSITVNPTKTTNYSVLTTNANGCQFMAEIQVSVSRPLPPTNVVALDFQSYIIIVWLGNDEEYLLYRNDELLSVASGNIYYDTEVNFYEQYCYYLRTVPFEDCQSLPSNTSCVTLTYHCDTPTNLTAFIEEQYVALHWDATENANYYTVYRENIEIGSTINNFYNDTLLGKEETVCYHIVSSCDYESVSEESNKACVEITSLEENANDFFNIYPNPAKQQITIEGKNMNQIILYNSLGQKIITQTEIHATQVIYDISTCEEGLYILKIITKDGKIFTRKVVVVQ